MGRRRCRCLIHDCVATPESSIWKQASPASDEYAKGKAVHYRMNPANVPALAAIQAGCLRAGQQPRAGLRPERPARNTLMSFPRPGFEVRVPDELCAEALFARYRPKSQGSTARVLIFAFGSPSSGIPYGWAAAGDRPGVHLVDRSDRRQPPMSCAAKCETYGNLATWRSSQRTGARTGATESLQMQTRFAHRLIDGGVDLVHGHSSHHPRPVEVYRKKLILYGCGDLVDDYEGIGSHQAVPR